MTGNVSKIDSTSMPRRYLALWFPFLPTDRLCREGSNSRGEEQDDRPLVVAEKVRGALRIAAVDPRASRLGLTPGLTLADAHARIANLAVAEADVASDARFIDRLAEFCDRFTPSVALDPPHGLVLDITGCAHLFGGEASLQASVLARLDAIGLNVRSSIACTPDAARSLARFSKVEIAPPGKSEALVKRLPVAALAGLERETVVALSRAGLKTIGDLSERPTQVLVARFGQGLVTRMMRTLGRENARITPLRSLPSVIVDRQFPEPFTQTAALEGILASLLEDAAGVMQERDEGGRAFEASFFRSDGAIRRLAVQTGRPSRDVPAILRLFRERLETLGDPIDAGFGFDAIRLSVPVTEALNQSQPHLDGRDLEGEANDNEAIGDLVDRLIVRFGKDRVLRFSACDTHDPDREAQLASAAGMFALKTPRVCWPQIEPGEPPLRPLQLFAPPQPIETIAEVPDGPPLRFRWRRVLHDVKRSEGPERIEPEWWRQTSSGNTGAQTRDYYRVEDAAGCRFWIFRQGFYGQADAQQHWFLHGVFA